MSAYMGKPGVLIALVAGMAIGSLAPWSAFSAKGEEERERVGVTGLTSPFREATTLRFAAPAASPVRLSVYDIGGRQLRRLSAPAGAAGERQLVWDGRDAAGRALPSGVYLFRLDAAGETRTGRLIKLR